MRAWVRNCVVLASCGVLACLGEVQSHEYATLAEAESEGAVRQGWLPSGLPADTRQIRLTYDLDTNATLIRLVSTSFAEMRTLGEAPIEWINPDVIRPPNLLRTRWWPAALRQPGPPYQLLRVVDQRLGGWEGGAAFVFGAVRADTLYLWRPIP